ncbi:MAG TPA: hypothetical protein VHY57_00380, partial [Rhizomicrobium sp.]|nr:hypothetical protein [Rhizomicrobium sp.]
VVFGLGGASTPKGTEPFTAAEVKRLRAQALGTQSLIAARATVVDKLISACAAPQSMKFFYDGGQRSAR